MNQLMMAGAYFAPFLILIQMVGNQATAVSAPTVTVEKPAVVQEVPEEPSSTLSDVFQEDTRSTGEIVQVETQVEVEALIRQTAKQLGVNEEQTVRIARCESGFRWNAKAKGSSAEGVFQFINSTWQTAAREAGIDATSHRKNPRSQVIAGVLYMKNHGVGAWRADPRSPACWDK